MHQLWSVGNPGTNIGVSAASLSISVSPAMLRFALGQPGLQKPTRCDLSQHPHRAIMMDIIIMLSSQHVKWFTLYFVCSMKICSVSCV